MGSNRSNYDIYTQNTYAFTQKVNNKVEIQRY